MPIKKTKITNAALHVTMPDGSIWAVPVWDIAYHRAHYYMKEFGGDVIRSLNEDTIPLFEGDEFEIRDWVQNNMDWSDVENIAVMITEPPLPDMQEGWVNGDKVIVYDNSK